MFLTAFPWSTPDRRREDGTELLIIPNEIYIHIFTYLDPSLFEDPELTREESCLILSNLSRVCRLFASICLPQIYKSLVFIHNKEKPKTPLEKLHMRLCTQLLIQRHPTVSALIDQAKSPLLQKLVITEAGKKTVAELAFAVEEFRIEGYANNGHLGTATTNLPDEPIYELHTAFVNKYLDAMMLMPNIQSLTLRNMWVTKVVLEKLSGLTKSNSGGLGIVLDGCSYSSEVLGDEAFRSLPIRAYTGDSEIAQSVLQGGGQFAAALQYLDLGYHKSLTPQTLQTFLEPFSSITSLNFNGQLDSDLPSSDTLPKTILPSLRKLKCNVHILRWFKHHLPSLTSLNIDDDKGSQTPPELSKLLALAKNVTELVFTSGLVGISGLFPNLRSVTIRTSNDDDYDDDKTLLDLLDHISSPHLERVTVNGDGYGGALNLDAEYTTLDSKTLKDKFPDLRKARFNPYTKWVWNGRWQLKFPTMETEKGGLLKRLMKKKDWVDWEGCLRRFLVEYGKIDVDE